MSIIAYLPAAVVETEVDRVVVVNVVDIDVVVVVLMLDPEVVVSLDPEDVVSTIGPEVVLVNNPVVVVPSVTEDVGVNVPIVFVMESSVGFIIAVAVPVVTVLFLIARSSIIVVTIVMIITVMLKTAQNFCPLSKYFQNPNIARPDKLAVPPN